MSVPTCSGPYPQPPPRRRRRSSRRGSCSGPTGCASADESSTGPTTACRSRASWSWPAAPRRPRASARRAARPPLAGTSSDAAVPTGIGVPHVAMFSLSVPGTPSIADQRLAVGPARLAGARGSQRGFGIVGIQRLQLAARNARCARSPRASPRPATPRAAGTAPPAPRRQADADQPCSGIASLPGHRGHVVDEDRRVRPQPFQTLLADRRSAPH